MQQIMPGTALPRAAGTDLVAAGICLVIRNLASLKIARAKTERKMEAKVSFKDYVIISCGTLAPELNHLRASGFLDAKSVAYTKPGRHEVPEELKRQLIQKIKSAREQSKRIIIVYGSKFCYVNVDSPRRTIDTIIRQHEIECTISRINATHCMDMLAGKEERDEIRTYLANRDCINSVFKINNGYDFLIEGVFKDIREVEDFIETIEDKFKIKSKQVYYIVDEIKREGFMTTMNFV